jgi:hypothetical protein
MGWRYGTSGRLPPLLAQSPEFKLQSHQKKIIIFKAYLIIMVNTCFLARQWWLTPVILATQEVEIRGITVRSQPTQIVHETLSR